MEIVSELTSILLGGELFTNLFNYLIEKDMLLILCLHIATTTALSYMW